MSNVINVAEHDYATYIISNAMQADDGGEGEPQIVYQVQEFLQDDNVEVTDVAFEGGTYQFITTDAGDEQENTNNPRYRREASLGSSGYWNEDDVNRLLKIYLKHLRKQRLPGKPNLVTWKGIYREFDTSKKFSKNQIKSKILRLKIIGKKILNHGVSERTPWPFWKSVREILELEESKNSFQEKTPGKDRWTNNDLLALLDVYEKNMDSIVKAGTNKCERMDVWIKIADDLGRAHPEVHIQYRKLKEKYERWKETCNPRHPLEKVFRKFQDVKAIKWEATEELTTSPSGRYVPHKYREKWGREETDRLLDVYLELLHEMHTSKQIKTRRAIYKLAGKKLNIHVQAIQVKLTSLKGHYKKFLNCDPLQSPSPKWRYADSMEKIMSYENAIWTQLDNTSINDELAEPEWFQKYRADVESRHNENMTVLEKLLSVMQRILES